ncbi:MAG: phosphoribosylformylglycinamidine synthase [Candidatus Amulumruptor caecigallinarius]|nr:phosphoribosylformylglycinamidine synthase [Candidatus Amulumruptor caecigallinarius]MCM1395879.1 phosphoribosylformylglycinamidine synthase [Candidatus Amulumruptor caecigallinarius]MCM1452914.1 phosphoribosylformylglycinamidine synthase [bacterium]
MVFFFKKGSDTVYAVDADHKLSNDEIDKLTWLLSGAKKLASTSVKGSFVGPRREMVTPWSTNAVEITQNAGIRGISRIEEFRRVAPGAEPRYDKMLQRVYDGLDVKVFDIARKPEPIVYIEDIAEYNRAEGLALSPDEEQYLRDLAARLGRPLTDSEVFGFSQVNSEHCRHKIFNGTFVIDGETKPLSLFKLIKKTSEANPGGLVSAYKDNVAFVKGPRIDLFYPANPEKPDYFEVTDLDTVLSLKAETHNFPTTVEPFNGAATGSGGEIRDRLGGGKASLPLAGTAVYMTSYPRLSPEHRWELMLNPRAWLYQTPADILIKASNGASDFGNKYGQPLICGSVLTFEHDENGRLYAYDKVIMLAGGVGFAARRDALKGEPKGGEKVVVMGGDNYRIGMGGGAVSSVATGQYDNSIELNAVQRANPEMQKRVANVIRALAESPDNPIISIHDHGAGGHLNALSELVEATGGRIDIAGLPVGDPTLSYKEIVGNESQERMGLVIEEKDIDRVRAIAERERAPFYVVGETTGDHRFVFSDPDGVKPIDLEMADMFGNSPKTVMTDTTVTLRYADPEYNEADIPAYIADVLSLEGVACKDWLTNKVDRSVTGKVARQQCQGELQLPLSDCGVVALDYTGHAGMATSIGHAPQMALVDSARGSVMAVAEALTNIVGTPIKGGISGLSLSANWMWPCKNPGEDAALYRAVEACSDFAIALGVNIPTGKDSLSMTQKYGDDKVFAPGTVIISAAGEVKNVRRTLSPVLRKRRSKLYYIDFSSCPLRLGGSALAQSMNRLGSEAPTVADPAKFVAAFNAVQTLVNSGSILAAHDVSAGGLVTTLLEMTFANRRGGIRLDADKLCMALGADLVKVLFAENPALVIQVADASALHVERTLGSAGVKWCVIGEPVADRQLVIDRAGGAVSIDIDAMRTAWYRTSYLLDTLQSGDKCAADRFANYAKQPVRYAIPASFSGKMADWGIALRHPGRTGVRAAIIREKGINGDREMAFSLYAAGFDVKDVHLSDLMSGRETLDDVNMIVFCGGFSNSDVLGSAKGWASGFRYNEKAREALRRFYAREDTLSLGVCNGCQLMVELGLLSPEGATKRPRMDHNVSHKFESNFLGVTIPENNTVMFGPLAGMKLGIWVAHGEGRFIDALGADGINVALRYSYAAYPGNPNGSRGSIAGIASADGRHLAMMPHLERAIFPWQCGYYPEARAGQEITPWATAFVNARRWIEERINQ